MEGLALAADVLPWPWSWTERAELRVTERPAFDSLFSEHLKYVGRTLRFLGVAEADLEDACQEVFLVVHRRLPEFDHEGSMRGWIRQICLHVARNERRRSRRRREDAAEDAAEISTDPTQHQKVELAELRKRLLVLLDGLSEDQRTVFVLYEIEELTMAEIASIVGCPLQTAYSRLHAARERIAASLRDSEVSS